MPLKINWLRLMIKITLIFKQLLIIIFVVLITLRVHSADGNKYDGNLMSNSSSLKYDSISVKKLINLAINNVYSNTDTSLLVAKQLIDTNNIYLSANQLFILNKIIGNCYVLFGKYDSATIYMRKSMEIGEKLVSDYPDSTDYLTSLSGIYINLGIISYYKARYKKAIEYYYKGLRLFEQVGYNSGIAICLGNIGNIYMDLEDYEKGLRYYKNSLIYAEKTGDLYDVSAPLSNIGYYYYSTKLYDSALLYSLKSKAINQQLNNETELVISYQLLAEIYFNLGQPDSATYYAQTGLKISNRLNKMEGIINNTYQLSEIYTAEGKYDSAIYYATEVIKLSKETGMSYQQLQSSKTLAKLYEITRQPSKAVGLYKTIILLKDSIFNTEKDKNISNLEAKYQVEKKEERISYLSEKNQLLDENVKITRLVFGSLSIILVLILVLILISYRSYKLKQLAENRKNQQETERKLLDTIIDTEYKERKRFAEDLHDGLGVLLSTVRLYINELRHAKTDEKRDDIITQSNNMLDEAIKNARNISNNIMPASLKKNGLEYALQSFCDKINSSGKINITLSSINFNNRLKSTYEINLFRILTELINNTLKHAGASKIEISFTVKGNKLFVTYKDNGKGFNYEKTMSSNKKGLGLNNTLNRIQSMGGKCEIKSSEGGGFFAGIELMYYKSV